MVTAAAPHFAGSHESGVAGTPLALTPITSVTFQSILQGLPFLPDEAPGAAALLNSTFAARNNEETPATGASARTEAARTSKADLRNRTSTLPATYPPKASSANLSTVENTAASPVLSDQHPPTPEVDEPAPNPPVSAELASLPKTGATVLQPMLESEPVNIKELSDNASAKLPVVEEQTAPPTPSFVRPNAPRQLSAVPVAGITASFDHTTAQQHFAVPASEASASFRQPSAPEQHASLSAPTPSTDQQIAPRDHSASQERSAVPNQPAEFSSVPADFSRNNSPIVVTPTPLPLEMQAAGSKADDDPRQAETSAQRSSVPGDLVQAEIDSVVNNRTQAISLTPRNENLAFSLKMSQNDIPAQRTQPTSQPEAARNEASSNTKSDTRSTGIPAATNANHEPTIVKAEVQPAAQATNNVWNETGLMANVTPRAEIQFVEQPPSVRPNAPTTTHEVAAMAPEPQRPSVSNEILLQLGGKDQPATVRVLDRAGTVNVSVHAADPDLRASLRSNLGDLASQLSHQGWKTEVVKTGTILTPGESSRDSSPDGQRAPGQQHSSSQGERQPQKDRRGNSGQWLAQFEESLSQNSSNSGGSN